MKGKNLFVLLLVVLLQAFCSDAFAASPSLIPLVGDKNIKPELSHLQAAIDNGADVNEVGSEGTTPLIEAIYRRRDNLVKFLLEKGADPNLKNEKGITPLYAALDGEYGPSDLLVKTLVAAGSRVGEPVSGGWIPLHKAAEHKYGDITAFLLENGAEVDAQNLASLTPLMCVEKNADNAVLLIDAGANVRATDNKGRTPLHFAARNNNTDVAFFLLNAGADVNSRDNSGKTPLHLAFEKRWSQDTLLGFLDFMLDKGADINAVASDGKSLLQIAEKKNNHEIISYLLDRGAICDIVASGTGEIATQALILNAIQANRSGLAFCFAQTLESIESPLLINDAGESLLHLAVKNRNSDLAKLLMKKGFDPNFQSKDGRSALHLAVSSDIEEAIVYLLRAGADPNLPDAKKVTPIQESIRFSRPGVVYELLRHFNPENVDKIVETGLLDSVKGNRRPLAYLALENKPKLEEKDEHGLTPLFYAIKNRWRELSLRLIKMGAQVNVADERGVTPLHLAASYGDRMLVKQLLQNHAAIDAEDKSGETPLFYAVKEVKAEISELLLEKGANLRHCNDYGRNLLFHCYYREYGLGTLAWLVQQGLPINSVDRFGGTVFHEMMRPIHCLSKIKKALKLGADWHIANKRGETPFTIALYGHNADLLNFVLTLKNDMARAKEKMNLVMHHWLQNKSYSFLEKALSAGNSPEMPDNDGKTLLIKAIETEDLVAAEMLFAAGAKLDPVIIEAPNLILKAMKYNRIASLKWLFDHHVDLDLQTEEGFSILWKTVGNWTFFDFLLDHGVKPRINELLDEKLADIRLAILEKKEGRERLKRIAGPELKKIVFAGENEVDRYRAVRRFISKGDLEGLKFAYELGFEINARGLRGNSLLHTAVLYKKLDIVKLLIGWGADADAKNDSGETPIQYAINYKANDIFKYFAETGVSLDSREKFGGAGLLHLAAKQPLAEKVFVQLFNRGFKVNDRDENGATPLLFAVEHGCEDTVDYLLQAGADPNIVTKAASSTLRTKVFQEKDFHFYRSDYHINNWIISGVGPLARAALRGQVPLIEKLVAKGARLEAADELGNTPLHLAVMGNSYFAVEALLKAGAPILVANCDGLTPLELAEKKGFFQIARSIWQKVPLQFTHDPTDVTSANDEKFALHAAVKEKRFHDLRWIVRRGAKIDELDDDGRTPLWLAVEAGSPLMVRILLELGASVNVSGPDGQSPWLKAFEYCYIDELLAILLEAGAKVDSVDKNGDTALHFAARRSKLSFIDFLLKHGAKLDQRNQAGCTPLLEAIMTKDRQKEYDRYLSKVKARVARQKEAMKKLPAWRRQKLPEIEENSEERRAISRLIRKDPIYMNIADIYGQTALHLAARKAPVYLLNELIDAGCDLEALDREGRTPIFQAIAAGNCDNVATLLKHGAKGLVIDKNSESTLSLADSLDRTDIVNLLIEAGVDQTYAVPEWPKEDENGTTRLMRAVAENRYLALKVLLAAGEDLNRKDKTGDTALFYAIRNCNYRMVKFLLENGADVNVENHYEQKPWQYAKQLLSQADLHDDVKGPPGFFPEQKTRKNYKRIVELLKGKK
jgi:ankyrin repeat protein